MKKERIFFKKQIDQHEINKYSIHFDVWFKGN